MLVQLADEGGLTQSQLAERCKIQSPTVTKMLQRMELQGLVERRPHPADRRVTQVFLTEKGLGLRQAVDEIWAELDARMIAGLRTEERLLLERLLIKVQQNLVDAQEEVPGR